ncbi:MAG: hypothetical protein LUC23_01940 [Prevotellaceae bacterium]|nr:hypothetical protein [Prevotellaceae bacterium]
MKRFGLTLMAALCISATTFAAGNQPTESNWYENINVNKLGRYLNLTADQHQEVTGIINTFGRQMYRAENAGKNQDKRVRRAVNSNLRMMWQTLDDKQYADYKHLMDVTLDNKGIELK